MSSFKEKKMVGKLAKNTVEFNHPYKEELKN